MNDNDRHDFAATPLPSADNQPPVEGAPSAQPPENADAPAPGRRRWVAAALGALGVALFAVPLLRGPRVPASTESSPGAATTTSSPGTCSAAKDHANFSFTLKDMSGADVQFADYKGKVVLLNFWATWCDPCKREIPEFVEAYNKYRDRGFVILGVLSTDDPSAEDLRAFMSRFKMNYPVFREHEEMDAAFGPLWALPTSFLIDRQGSICLKHMGPVSKEMLEREIRGLL